mmetsp:Transcript_17847/g.53504  ORF Transcript_17847/g.53504 Transcript_17847/m.53504 type:complete len:238 (-) Transcript_17847:320-1033(-)
MGKGGATGRAAKPACGARRGGGRKHGCDPGWNRPGRLGHGGPPCARLHGTRPSALAQGARVRRRPQRALRAHAEPRGQPLSGRHGRQRRQEHTRRRVGARHKRETLRVAQDNRHGRDAVAAHVRNGGGARRRPAAPLWRARHQRHAARRCVWVCTPPRRPLGVARGARRDADGALPTRRDLCWQPAAHQRRRRRRRPHGRRGVRDVGARHQRGPVGGAQRQLGRRRGGRLRWRYWVG